MDKQNEVLLNTFVISKKKYRVVYNAGVLVWEAENSKKGKISVPVSDIISVTLSATASGRSAAKNAPHAITTTYGTTSSTHAPMNEDMDFDRVPVLPTSASISTTATINTTTTTTNISNRADSYDLLHTDATSVEDIICGNNQSNGNYLIIHYARLVAPRVSKWRVQQLVLYKNEHRIVKLWYQRLSEDIREQNRPKNLLLFLNPYGGKQKAFALFEKYAKPLFKLAQVDINLIITQRAQQIYDIMTSQTINLNNYDGVVCCGGDGTFAELFNGLVYRTMIDLGMDINQPPYLPKPSIPIGIIPAGSTDTVAYCLNGTTDIKTSILHIILGQTHGLDISSVYRNSDDSGGGGIQNGDDSKGSDSTLAGSTKVTQAKRRPQLLKLYASVLSYGFLGDVTLESENYRWMGPKRYDYSGAKKFFRNRGYSGDITIHVENEVIDDERVERNNPHDGVRCLENCQRCLDASAKSGNPIDCDTQKVTVSGKFLMVKGANISCACSRSPQGFNPYCHLGDGYLDLILVRHTSFFNNIRLLLAMSSKTKKISDLPFVEIYRTKKFSFKGRVVGAYQGHGHDNGAIDDELDQTGTTSASSASTNDIANSTVTAGRTATGSLKEDNKLLSKWNCDGEILMDTNIIVECNCQLINVFRRGVSCSDTSSKENDPGVLNCCGICK